MDTYENKDKENNLIKEIIDLRLKENFDEKRINEIYQETLKSKNPQLKNSLSNLFNNWGITLYNLAKAKDNNEDLYNQAFNKYETASILNPKNGSIFNNWGTALYNLAKAKDNNEDLYNQAFNKYETASILNPKNHSIFYNWGTALYYFAKAKDNNEDLYNEAFEKLTKATELGDKVYNLACFHSIRKNKKEALELLEKSLTNKEVSISSILKDEDWDNFKEDEDFKKLIEKYR
ncbi:TPR end-of-group domain-containing protein [Aliarcobacter butzleri]|uniref:TPR end-of-group domain-containing protein n=1 Tax=Aliarcobacter butzleri TaxID=28197 RepID=UPI003AF5C357